MKTYNFNINNADYKVTINNCILDIYDSKGCKVSDSIAIADAYVDNEKLIMTLVTCILDVISKKAITQKLLDEAVQKLRAEKQLNAN